MTHATADLVRQDIAFNLHPYTNLALHEERGPMVIARGEGIYVWDDAGNKYIEGLAGLWCVSLGFSEERLRRAAEKQLGTLPFAHNFAHRTSAPATQLAARLIEVAPAPMAKAYFVNSGSEAVDTAIKIIWYYNNGLGRPQKKKIISRKRGYHGVTVAAGSLTAIPLMQNDFDLPLPRMLHTDTPCHYRHGLDGESEEQFAARLAQNLDDLITREGADTVAAFIAEPVMGAGGLIVPPATYFTRVQEVLRRHDVLMVADEVICGFGRTGNWWGSDTYHITPDLVTCAKQLSSGYLPIGAVMVSQPIYETLTLQSKKHGAFGTGNTYGGHPVPAAVALETLEIYRERDILGHVRKVAPLFQRRLAALAEHALVGEARGVGLIGGLEIVADKASKKQFDPAHKAALTVTERALAHGLIIRPLPGDCIGICPPLVVSEEQINSLFDKLEQALPEAAAALA